MNQIPTQNRGPAKEVKSPYESWSLYFDETGLSKIGFPQQKFLIECWKRT